MQVKNENNKIILYKSEDGKAQLEVRLENETVWLTQAQMSELFDKDIRTISEHIKNIYREGELTEESSIQAKSGNSGIGLVKPTKYYNLDVIISVGYRVKSLRGTQFRIWATQKLKEYIVKGFVMDDERLAEGGTRRGYFDELIERVRRIRASERNLYEKVKDIFATSADYDPKVDFTKEFYATMQNKFHYAVTGYTAAELVATRISSNKENLGLTCVEKQSVTRKEAGVAKNYMLEKVFKSKEVMEKRL